DPGFKAVLLKRHYELPTAEVPKLDDVIDALAWKLIGFEGAPGKFTVKNVKTAVLNRALGDGRAADFKKAASRLVARRAGARREDAQELRDAVLRGWIDRNCEPAAQDQEPEPRPWDLPEPDGRVPPEAPGPRTQDPQELAGRVLAAARGCSTG